MLFVHSAIAGQVCDALAWISGLERSSGFNAPFVEGKTYFSHWRAWTEATPASRTNRRHMSSVFRLLREFGGPKERLLWLGALGMNDRESELHYITRNASTKESLGTERGEAAALGVPIMD